MVKKSKNFLLLLGFNDNYDRKYNKKFLSTPRNKEVFHMPCNCSCGGNDNFLDNLLGSGDTEILLFLVVFLLLFTSFGRR